MSDRRISLTRILAVNWYGFRQIIDISNNTLISGAFGTGKSALLDLMQCVMLGEHWRPNRAAAGNARGRTLAGYCLCDTNTTRDGEPHFVRSSAVTIAGIEFTWPAEKDAEPRRETWGIRFEFSSPTAEPKRTYFLIPERVEWSSLAPDNRMLDEDEFRTWIRRDFGREFIFPRQQDYLAEMATSGHLSFDPDQFHKTFPKAIAFEPEENVEKFIREFILEENPLDVRDVKTAVWAYRDTQARLEKQEDEASHLRRVETQHETFVKARREAVLFEHIRHALDHARHTELVERHELELKTLREKNDADNRLFDTTHREAEQIEQQLKEFVLDSGDAELDSAQKEKRESVFQLNTLREAQKSVRDRLRQRASGWSNWLKGASRVRLDGLTAAINVDESLLAALKSDDDAAGLKALPQLAARFEQLFGEAGNCLGPVKRQLENDNARLRQLAEDLERIERNETPGAFPLFQAIKTRLAGSSNPPEQFCRLIEVKPDAEDWRPALELFLGRNRFAVVVSPQDYSRALDIFKTVRSDTESLVHPREALELPTECKAGSLAEKIDSTNAVAASFAKHLLGRVIGVGRVEDLDSCERGITRDGIFKQVPTRRRLRATPGTEFTLGIEGIKRLKAAAVREQRELMADRDQRQALIESAHRWLDDGRRAGLGDASLPDRSGELFRIPELGARIEQLSKKIDFLLTDERKARLQKRDELQKALSEANKRIGALGNARQAFDQRHRELTEALDEAREDQAAAALDLQESRVKLPTGTLDSEIERLLAEAKAVAPRWNERVNAALRRSEEASLLAVNARNARDAARRDLIASDRHPEYRHDFVADEESNDKWSARLKLLEETQLPEFRKLATERRKDWEKRLQESVLDRLNERVNEAERTVRLLRDYLDRDIGRYRYRITYRRDPAYAPLWELLDSGFEPTDELLMASRSREVQDALNQLMSAVEAADQADDRARRLLDYRQYHRYDLEMTLANRPDAPSISLGRSGRNLSGGENQAPFFISMLAAFRRVYATDTGARRSQHIGLVLMDEAFSKLSGDGVEDCLELAANFDLQLVLAFPPEKLGVMSPYADTVILCRKEEQRDAAGYVTRIDNIPILLTQEQVKESLE